MIEIKNLSVSFGEKIVISRLELTLPAEGIICLTGPSGCGKTTLLRALAGMQKYSGEISGIPGQIAYMFQDDRLIPWLTALENVRFALPQKSAGTAEYWLEKVGLGNELSSLPSALSGGMCRRVALARALATESEILLLDEPFKGADSVLTEKLAALVRERGVPVIAVTHSETEAALLGGQRLIFSGPPLTPLSLH